MTTIALFAATLTAAVETPTFGQIEALRQKVYANEQRLVETTIVSGIGDDSSQVMKRTLAILGDKLYSCIGTGDEKSVETGRDGKEAWAILYEPKIYMLSRNPSASPLAGPHEHAERLEVGESAFDFGSERPVSFRTNPPLKFVSLTNTKLEGKPARLVVAKAHAAKNQRFWELRQWFLADRWLLVRAEMVSQIGQESPKQIDVRAKLDFQTEPNETLFRLDLKKVEGFTKVGG